MSTEFATPTGIALVLCDNVYHDSHGKRALVGLFNQITSTDFPAVQPRMCVMVSLTSLRPQTECKLDIVHSETEEPVVEMGGPLPQDDPLIRQPDVTRAREALHWQPQVSRAEGLRLTLSYVQDQLRALADEVDGG